jgi:hypothetical protein
MDALGIVSGARVTVQAVTHADKGRNNQVRFGTYGRERRFKPYIHMLDHDHIIACLDPTMYLDFRVPETSWTCISVASGPFVFLLSVASAHICRPPLPRIYMLRERAHVPMGARETLRVEVD